MPKDLNSPRRKATRQEQKDIDHEILFLEGLVRRDESYVEALQILGDNYTRRGRYQEGLEIDERLVKLRPEDPMVRYNLACSYSLTSQVELACRALETALNLGYVDFEWMAKDPDLEGLRKHPSFKKIQAKIRLRQAKAR